MIELVINDVAIRSGDGQIEHQPRRGLLHEVLDGLGAGILQDPKTFNPEEFKHRVEDLVRETTQKIFGENNNLKIVWDKDLKDYLMVKIQNIPDIKKGVEIQKSIFAATPNALTGSFHWEGMDVSEK